MDNKVVLRIPRKQLFDLFSQVLLDSNFAITSMNIDTDPMKIIIDDGVKKFEMNLILKTLSQGGWKDNPEIKRIQVANVKDGLVYTNKKRTYFLCGITKYLDKIIVIVWNAYLYTKHNTNRSCYVRQSSIEKCYREGYCMVNDFDQEILLCDQSHFGLLIRDYIMFNYMEKIEC